jgi:hypothetical protein
MNESDVRDERLAELLDRAVRAVQPSAAPERAIRTGDWRRAARLAASILTAVVFLTGAVWAASIVGTDEEQPADDSTIVSFTSSDAPWTFDYPSNWHLATQNSASPDRAVNVLRTTVANGELPEGASTHGPNSEGDTELTSALGEAGAVVLVQREWGGALSPPEPEPRDPGPFADDRQSPGWTYRERVGCDGTLCFRAVEWFGPAASQEDRAVAAAIASSVRLADLERWTETDGVETTLHDEDDLFTITYPADWFVSDVPINDRVCSPFEILALATYPLRPGGEAVIDAQLPSKAVEDMGPNDILIWVNDSGNSCGGERTSGDGSGFPERPEHLAPSEPCENWTQLCAEPNGDRLDLDGVRAWWLGFADAGRGFYAFVGMGVQAYADDARAQLAWDVLDSLRFLPR